MLTQTVFNSLVKFVQPVLKALNTIKIPKFANFLILTALISKIILAIHASPDSIQTQKKSVGNCHLIACLAMF